jgi:hypothetical protein
VKDPGILGLLIDLIQPELYGDPMTSLWYVSGSPEKYARNLAEMGHPVSPGTVAGLIRELGIRPVKNRKLISTSKEHPQRDEQFQRIQLNARIFMECGEPAVSLDAKKKENIGNYSNSGTDCLLPGVFTDVLDHDFTGKDLGKATPFGYYTINRNHGYVVLGTSHDTSDFAVEGLRINIANYLRKEFPGMTKLMTACDSGGSDGYSRRAWKCGLAGIAREFGIEIHVFHYTPGASKWNRIEHALFGYTAQNWRARPLESLEVMLPLIKSTTTTTGLVVEVALDMRDYPTGASVSDEDFASAPIAHDFFLPDLNYVIYPSAEAALAGRELMGEMEDKARELALRKVAALFRRLLDVEPWPPEGKKPEKGSDEPAGGDAPQSGDEVLEAMRARFEALGIPFYYDKPDGEKAPDGAIPDKNAKPEKKKASSGKKTLGSEKASKRKTNA